MKLKILFFSILLILTWSNINSREAVISGGSSLNDSIIVMSSPDLSDLVNRWAKEYCLVFPTQKISVITIDDNRNIDLNAEKHLGFVSNEYYSLLNKPGWKEIVGRDVIVPVINSENPFINEINAKGVKTEKIAQAIAQPENRNWSTLIEKVEKIDLEYYTIKDELLKSTVAGFLKSDQLSMNAIETGNGNKLVSAIQKDRYGFGFCRLTDIIDPETNEISSHISLMPIDRNGNGEIDYNENIYSDLYTFTRGVWIGKYPRELFSNIYTFSAVKPVNESDVAFLTWVLTDGQKYMMANGYTSLALNERKSKIDQMVAETSDITAPVNTRSKIWWVLYILASVIVVGFLAELWLRFIRRRKVEVYYNSTVTNEVFNENSVSILNGLYFDKSHTWVFMEKEGMVKIGIDDFLQHATGTLTAVHMKSPGERIKKGEPVFTIVQQGKKIRIKSPVSGIIKEYNERLSTNSSLVNTSPYSEGWIYLIEPTNWIKELPLFIMAEQYRNWLKNEFSRLRDFLAEFVKPDAAQYAHVVLQDGGELKDRFLSELGPEVWEEFQINFIDNSK